MYIPKNCKSLKDSSVPQIRLAIQGYGGTGKTWSALTFPNPVVLNIDNGLGAHQGREDVIDVRLWDKDYCKTLVPNYTKFNLRDVIDKWFEVEAPKLEKGQTLVIDGNTGIQNAYHLWYSANMVTTKAGKVDDFGEWNLKKPFYANIFETLKTLQCDVVYLCHESEKKEKNGEYLGKVRPLLTGSVGDEMVGHFTDFFRQFAQDKPTFPMAPEKLAMWKMTEAEMKNYVLSYKDNTVYFWQTESSDIFDAKRSSLVDAPRFIPAHYNSFLKFRRKIEEPNPMAFHSDLSNLPPQ